jgi:transposase
MQVLYQRCAAIDVGKDVIAVAVRLPGDGSEGRQTVKRTFTTFFGVLKHAAWWLAEQQVTHVAMEATGIYSMPVYHALLEYGDFEQVLVCNAGHVRNVPGRKTDLSDAEWLVHLLECGLLRASFIPPAEIKAVRDILRYRTKLVQSRSSELSRLGNVLQDAGVKLDSVASALTTKSARAMVEALIDGERRPGVLADLAKGRMRAKIPDLARALEGRFGEHHALMCQLHLDHLDHLDAMIATLDAQVEGMMQPFRVQRDLLSSIPGIGPLASAVIIWRDRRRRRDLLRHSRPLGVLVRAVSGQSRIRRQAVSRDTPQGQSAPAAGAGRVRLGCRAQRRLSPVALPATRHEIWRVPQRRGEEESDHRRRAQTAHHRLVRAGHRQALPGPRPRLLHHPHRPRNRNPSIGQQTPSPRPHRHPRTRRLIQRSRTRLPYAPPGGSACPGHLNSRISHGGGTVGSWRRN